MPKGHLSVEKAAELCARLIRGDSPRSIAAAVGLCGPSVKLAWTALRGFGVTLPTPVARPHRPEVARSAERLFAAWKLNNREIAKELGCSAGTINTLRRKYVARLAAAGAPMPLCVCGQHLHHGQYCSARSPKLRPARRALAGRPEAERAEVRRRLLEGQSLNAVARWLRVSPVTIRSFYRGFSDEERQQHEEARRLPAARKRAAAAVKVQRPGAVDARADPTYLIIMAAIPKRIPRDLAGDIAADTYLALLEGRCTRRTLRAHVKAAIGENFERFANPWGDLSLDATRGDEGESTWIEALEDPRALAAFDATLTD